MAVPNLCSTPIQLLYLSSIYLLLIVPHGGSVSFNLTFSNRSNMNEYINFEGDAYYDNTDKIDLSKNSATANVLGNSTGRATYNQPVPLWDKDTGEATNFTTRFSFLIQNTTPNNYGDGFACFLSSYPSQIPPDGGGKYLGLFNSSTGMNASANQVVAVEFDTFLNQIIDPDSIHRSDDCHIGIDINMIESTSYQLIPNYLFVGTRMTAQIEYNSWLKLLSLSLWQENNLTTQFNLSANVDIRNLPPNASVGFSAATGASFEAHQIVWWSFNSTLEMKQISPILAPSEAPSANSPLDPNMQLYTSSQATSSVIGTNSTKSAPAPSSDSSWLLKQEPRTF